MKRTLAFIFLMVCGGVLLGDSPGSGSLSRKPATLLEDLVRMTRAGSSTVTVLAFAKAHRMELPPEINDNDLRWLRNSGVNDAVVSYMRAIDVRGTDESAPVFAASGYSQDSDHLNAASSDSGRVDDGYAGSYADDSAGSTPDNSYDSYAGYDSYPFYGSGYFPYPYASYVFVDRNGFSHRIHLRDPRNGGHRMHDVGRGHRAEAVVPSRDSWRERGFSGPRGTSRVVGPRESGRPVFARGNVSARFQGPPRRVNGPRGLGPSGLSRSSSPHVIRGASGGFGGHSSRVATGSRGGRGR